MTANASVSSQWTPDDDLLLKNSIEAGASLEALAKGAVNFSHRFTFREIRDRWYSLLYDPNVSAQACACMVELELSGSIPSSKHSRLDNLKGSEKAPEKKKRGSIRRQYFAMRKRMKNEFFNSAGLGFFEQPTLHNCSSHEHNFQDHVTLNHDAQGGDTMLGDCLANNLGFEETEIEILRQAFPETIGSIGAANVVDNTPDAFQTAGCHNSVGNDYANGSVREGSVYKFAEDVSPLIRNGLMGSFDPNVEPKNTTDMHKGNSDNFVKCIGVEEVGPSQAFPNGKLLKTESQAKPASTYDSMNEGNQILCSGFGGKQHFNSPGSDGSASFHTMGFSSPLPRLPLWRTMEDVSAPDMPVDENNAGSNQAAEDTLPLPEDGDHRRHSSPGYDDARSVSFLGDRPDNADFINSGAVTGGEYTDLPDSLLNFSNEDDILYMNADGKDIMDENPNSQLPGSPDGVLEGSLCNAEVTTSLVPDVSLAIPSPQCPEKLKDIASSFHGDQQNICHAKVDVPSKSSHTDSLHLTEGQIICTLNTEDTEIPCNDDIFLLIHPTISFDPPIRQLIGTDSMEPLSSSADEKDGEQVLKDPAPSFSRSHMFGPNVLSEPVSAHPPGGCTVKSESPDNNKCVAPLLGQPNKPRNTSQSRSVLVSPRTIRNGVLQEDVNKVEYQDVENPVRHSAMALHAEDCSMKIMDPESMDNPSISDQNDSESDDDIPCFSDVEAMILEMDLTYAQDSCINSEVAQYQYEASKRTIIRLEQTARSSLERAMGCQGAFAIFYGRHLKHYIKKTEVTIGRSTDDTDVDIDLRKEGRANKISRRQASIKMETDGSFNLKNLGKSSISMNGKAVASGQVVALSTSCLIEIRGMSFVFEINDKYVRRYMDNLMKKSQGENGVFKWSPEGEP